MVHIHYQNGRWVPEQDLAVSAFDLSVLRGFGVFDYFRTYNRIPFRLADNIERFAQSAQTLNLEIPVDTEELEEIIEEGLERNPDGELGVRMILTGGVSKDTVTPGTPSLILMFLPAEDPPLRYFTEGVRLVTWAASRRLAETKSLDYMQAIIARQYAENSGAVEALYVDEPPIEPARLYECTTSNIFAIRDGQIVTPRHHILGGVTRKVVMELAEELGIPVVERDLFTDELHEFDEAFLTSSNKQVVPVVHIDEQTIGNGQPGPISQQLHEAFMTAAGKRPINQSS